MFLYLSAILKLRFSGWYWCNLRLISFDHIGRLLSLYSSLHFWISCHCLWFLTVAIQTIECWMRSWVAWYDLEVDSEEHMYHVGCGGDSIACVHLDSLRYLAESSKWIFFRPHISLNISLEFLHCLGDSLSCSQHSLWYSDMLPYLSPLLS